ncbi:hypothetical protein Ndes2526B_g05608 [Nannochloris sp. 'desiccata']
MSADPSSEEPLLSVENGGTDASYTHYLSLNEAYSCSKTQKQVTKLILNLVSATTGTSTISVPLMALTLGLVPTILVMLLQSGLGVFANHVISQEAQEEGVVTYKELMRRRIGPKAGEFAAAAVILMALASLYYG